MKRQKWLDTYHHLRLRNLHLFNSANGWLMERLPHRTVHLYSCKLTWPIYNLLYPLVTHPESLVYSWVRILENWGFIFLSFYFLNIRELLWLSEREKKKWDSLIIFLFFFFFFILGSMRFVDFEKKVLKKLSEWVLDRLGEVWTGLMSIWTKIYKRLSLWIFFKDSKQTHWDLNPRLNQLKNLCDFPSNCICSVQILWTNLISH